MYLNAEVRGPGAQRARAGLLGRAHAPARLALSDSESSQSHHRVCVSLTVLRRSCGFGLLSVRECQEVRSAVNE